MLVTMLKDTKTPTLSQFLTGSFSRVSSAVARKICEAAKLSVRAPSPQDRPARSRFAVSGDPADQDQRPATDCMSPIGEDRLLKGLHHVVPAEFYVASTRPPAVYRGNPFQIEVGAGLRRRVDRAASVARNAGGAAWQKATPARCGSS